MGWYRGQGTYFVFEPGRWHGLGHNFAPPDAFDLGVSQRDIRVRVPDFRWTATPHGATYRTMQDEKDGVYTLKYTFLATGNGRTYTEPFNVRLSHMGLPRPVLNPGVLGEVIARALDHLTHST